MFQKFVTGEPHNLCCFAVAFAWTDPLPEFVDHWQALRNGVVALAKGFGKDSERLSAPLP